MPRGFGAVLSAILLLFSFGAAAEAQDKKDSVPPKTVESPRRVSDTVQTLIELAESNPDCATDLQAIYDMLRKLDTGKDGKIDLTALKGAAEQIVQDRVKNVFTRLDANKDGKISKDEARGLIKDHFDKIDSNKDGFIEFDELLQAAKQRREEKAGNAQAPLQKQK